jgi:hypothetical protein
LCARTQRVREDIGYLRPVCLRGDIITQQNNLRRE